MIDTIMGKSLKELLKENPEKDKDLADLLKSVEESYIYKGLNFVDDKLRLSKYYPNSKITKGFDTVKDFMFYANILGVLPGEKQEKYAKYLRHDKLLFTKYSLMYFFPLGAAKLTMALLTPPPVSIGFYIWSISFLAEDAARLTYILAKKKPIGSIVYIEIPYRIIKPALNKIKLRKKKNKDSINNLETNNLNTSKNLNLS